LTKLHKIIVCNGSKIKDRPRSKRRLQIPPVTAGWDKIHPSIHGRGNKSVADADMKGNTSARKMRWFA
jgi:hypothetical protein